MVLHIDLETFSSVNLKKAGLYKYVQSPDFEILLFAYAYDNDPVTVIDMAQGEKLTEQLIYDLKNPEVIKMAHNAAFEFYCLSKFYVTKLEQWRCSMVHALYCGYPASLDAVGEAMNFPQDKKKLGIGRSLIKFFAFRVSRQIKMINGQETCRNMIRSVGNYLRNTAGRML